MLQEDLREFIALLNSHEVDYLIVGGHAVAFHGYPRFTGDIDFWVRRTPENAARLMAVLRDFGFGEAGLDSANLTLPQRVIQLGRPPNRIDLLTSVTGVEFDAAWGVRVASQLDGLPVWFIDRVSLLQNKRAARRAKDLDDIEKLGSGD